MQGSRWCWMLVALVSCMACVEYYIPPVEGFNARNYVVNGEVTSKPGYQYITVSITTPVNDPHFTVQEGCEGYIEDDLGNRFPLEEYNPGNYRTWMDAADLKAGTSYRLQLTTPDKHEIQSFFDKMPQGIPIDTIYYEKMEKISQNTQKTTKGLQFYLDLNGTPEESRYLRWTVLETWEYNAAYAREYYYDGDFHKIWPHDNSTRTCWSTVPVKQIFTLSTEGLVNNSFGKVPIHFVSNTTNRLYVKYSAMISQHSLSEAAYTYWEQLRINGDEQGGMYEKQPLKVKGNLYDVASGDEVFGFFGASSVSEKRIFVDAVKDMDVYDGYFCDAHPLGIMGWREFFPEDYPVFYTYWGLEVRILDNICIDCRDLGGTLTKPEFWP